MKTFRNQNFLIHHQIPIDFRNMGGAMESLLRGPKIQGVLVAARNPHHPGKVAGSPRLPQEPQVYTGGSGSQDPRPPPPLFRNAFNDRLSSIYRPKCAVK